MLERETVLGYCAVVPLHGWSSHVGEIRLIVDPAHRGEGVGTALARHATLKAFRAGLSKLVVEVLATQEFTIAMFSSLGFDPEALLPNPRQMEAAWAGLSDALPAQALIAC